MVCEKVYFEVTAEKVGDGALIGLALQNVDPRMELEIIGLMRHKALTWVLILRV